MLAVGHAPAQDTPAPTVSGVSFFSTPASGSTYQRGDTIEVRVDFDRAVTVTGTPRVNLTVGTRTRAAAFDARLSGTGFGRSTLSLFFAYTVQEEDRDTDGVSVAANAIGLNGGTIEAADGTTDAGLTHDAVTDAAGHQVDGSRNAVPAVSGISFVGSPASGDTYQLGETIELKVVFDRFVEMRGSSRPQVELTIGGQTRLAAYSYARGTGGISDYYFEYEVQSDDLDTDGISIAADAIRLNGATLRAESDASIDADLTHAAVPDDATRKVDGSQVTRPSVTDVRFNGIPDRGGAYRTGETIEVQVWFDRLVNVSGDPTVELTIGNRTREAALATVKVGVQGLGFRYTVQEEDLDGDGISVAADAIRLNGATITAVDGTTDADLTHPAVPADPTHKVGTPPAVSDVSVFGTPTNDATYQRGERIVVRVAFDRGVVVTGSPSVNLTVGAHTRTAAITEDGLGATYGWLFFAYAVGAEDRDADGIGIPANAISLNGGTIKAAADAAADAVLTHAEVADDAGQKVDGSRTAPAVSGVSFVGSPAAGDTYRPGETIEVKVTFDQFVSLSGTPQVALTIGGQTRLAAYSDARGSGGITDLHFEYVVQDEDRDDDGIGIAADAVRLNGATITAAGGSTNAVLTHPAVPADATRKVGAAPPPPPADGAPTVSGVSFFSTPASGGTYQRGDTIEVRVDFDRAVAVTGAPRVNLTVGARTRAAAFDARLSGTSFGRSALSLFFAYTVQAEDRDTDGVSVAANAIRLNGGTIEAADGSTGAGLRHDAVADAAGHQVDGSRNAVPAVSSISFVGSPASGDTYQLGETIELKVVFDRFVEMRGRPGPQVALTIGGQTRPAAYSYARGTGGISDYYFEYEVQSDDFDADGISIAADAIRLNGATLRAESDAGIDADLTHAAVPDDATRKVDGVQVARPSVTAVRFIGTPRRGSAYRTGETIEVQVWFDRLVNVSGDPTVELTIGNRTREAALATVKVGVQGLGFRYTVQAADRDDDGISVAADAIRLNGATITAVDGATDADLTHPAVPADPTRTVGDGTAPPPAAAPSVSSIVFGSSPASGDTYEQGETIDVWVLFTGFVRVGGSPRMELTIGSDTRTAAYWGSHHGRTLSFRYTVQAADRDDDGIGIAADAIRLAGGSITSSDGSTDAALEHAAVASDPGHKVDGSRVTAPSVTGVSVSSRPRGGSAYVLGESIVVEVRFSEPVTVTGGPRLALTIGSATRGAAFVRSDRNVLWFRYRVQAADRDADGIGIAAGALSLNGGAIRDRDEHDARLDLGRHAIANASGHAVDADLVDAVPPTVTGVALTSEPQDGSAYVLGETIEIEVRFSEPVTVTGSPRLTLTVGSRQRTAAYASSRLQTVRFRYVVAAADGGALRVAADALSLNGGTILDAAGNAANLSLGSAAIALGDQANGVRRDDDPPTVESVRFESGPQSGDAYTLGDVVEVAVRFSEPVTVTGSPRLSLSVGAATRRAAFFSSEGRWVRFHYVVQERDSAPNGVGVAGLSLNGGAITDAAGNAANLSLAAASVDTGDRVDSGPAQQTVPTRVAVTSQPRSGDTYTRGESVDVEVRFNKAVSVDGQPRLELTIGPPRPAAGAAGGRLAAATSHASSVTRQAALVSSTHERLHFRYVVQAGDGAGGGRIFFADDALRLNGGTITDAAGEPLDRDGLTLAAAEVVPGDLVDGSLREPAVARRAAVISVPQADRVYRLGESILIDVQFDTGVTVSGAPRLELAIGTAARRAGFVSVEHDTIRFRYDVQAGDRDDDGIAIAPDALRLNGGAIRDAAGDAVQTGLQQAEIVIPADTVDGSVTERTAPVVESVSIVSEPRGGAYAHGDRIAVAVRFSEPVQVTGNPRLELRIGSAARMAAISGAARSIPEVVEFAYTLRVGDPVDDGIGIPPNALRLNGGSIRDDAGNDADLRSSEVLPVARQAEPDARLACKQPVPSASRAALQAASLNADRAAREGSDFELTLVLDENRDGSTQAVELGCVALAAPDRRFSYSITRGDRSRFAVGAADGVLRYVGPGESAERTPEYAVTVTATPRDRGQAMTVRVRVVVARADGPGPAARRERMLQAGMTGFGRTAAASAVHVIGARIASAARSASEPDAADAAVILNGRSLSLSELQDEHARAGMVRGIAEALGVRVQPDGQLGLDLPSGPRLVADSAFSASLAAGHGTGAARWGVWGSGDLSRFSGDTDGFEQDGGVLSGYLGADYRFVPNALAGLAASYSHLDLTSTSPNEDAATLTGALVSVYPYGLWMPEEWLELWSLAGFGAGRAELTDAGGAFAGDVRTWLGAAGQRVELWSDGQVALAAKSDGFVTGVTTGGGLPDVSAHAWRARLLAEAGMTWRPQDSRLSGIVEVGARLDGGDAERGLGAEVGAELGYAHTGIGLGLTARGRLLLVHEDRNVRDWGASAALTWEPPDRGSGPAVSVAPVWGRLAGGAEALWRDPEAVRAARAEVPVTDSRSSWLPDAVDLKVGYGLDLPHGAGRLAPFAEIGFEHGSAPRYRFGLRGSLEY